MSIFQASSGVGIMLGSVLAGVLAAAATFLFSPSLTVALSGVAAMNFFLSSALGPCVALAVSLVPGTRRGVTSTLMLVVQNLMAFAFGPLLVGVVSDAWAPIYGDHSLRYALALMLVAPVIAALFLIRARSRIR